MTTRHLDFGPSKNQQSISRKAAHEGLVTLEGIALAGVKLLPRRKPRLISA